MAGKQGHQIQTIQRQDVRFLLQVLALQTASSLELGPITNGCPFDKWTLATSYVFGGISRLGS